MDLLTWLKLHWRQNTQRTKWLNWCEGRCWAETFNLEDGRMKPYKSLESEVCKPK